MFRGTYAPGRAGQSPRDGQRNSRVPQSGAGEGIRDEKFAQIDHYGKNFKVREWVMFSIYVGDNYACVIN